MQTVKTFIEKVKSAGNKDVTLYMYPGEGHGFMNGGKDIHEKMKSKQLSMHDCFMHGLQTLFRKMDDCDDAAG